MHFYSLIEDLYAISTANAIRFGGKGWYYSGLLPGLFCYLSFGASFVVLSLSNLNQKLSTIGKSLTIYIILFEVSLLTICFTGANWILLECTMCDDGKLWLPAGSLEYQYILGTSTLIAIIPSAIRWIKS
jgi:hypothetical protein